MIRTVFYRTSCIFFIVATYLILMLPIDQINHLADEDGIIENAGVLGFLLAVVLFFISFLKSKGRGVQLAKFRTKRQPIFLLLALLFFVALGEEISWGQRIFGWDTPEVMQRINSQQETNLHNLRFIHGQNADGSYKTGMAAWFTAHRIFYAIVIFWALLIPILHRYSMRIRVLLNKINFPVHPIWMGITAFGVLVLGKALKLLLPNQSQDWRHAVSELSEANLAVMIAFIGIYWVVESKNTN